MLFFKPIDLRILTIVSHSKPIKLRRRQNGYIYILFFKTKIFTQKSGYKCSFLSQ